uniref:Uncharacterized protein n=1 Tax=Uronema confervicola TaxID=764120 RepID=A0A6H1U7N6_9CHLO|nr:hypothetical protein [Uronema confervicola]QIZ74190.1 hypothetical protein [Uronema confervicola]
MDNNNINEKVFKRPSKEPSAPSNLDNIKDDDYIKSLRIIVPKMVSKYNLNQDYMFTYWEGWLEMYLQDKTIEKKNSSYLIASNLQKQLFKQNLSIGFFIQKGFIFSVLFLLKPYFLNDKKEVELDFIQKRLDYIISSLSKMECLLISNILENYVAIGENQNKNLDLSSTGFAFSMLALYTQQGCFCSSVEKELKKEVRSNKNPSNKTLVSIKSKYIETAIKNAFFLKNENPKFLLSVRPVLKVLTPLLFAWSVANREDGYLFRKFMNYPVNAQGQKVQILQIKQSELTQIHYSTSVEIYYNFPLTPLAINKALKVHKEYINKRK